MCVIVTSKSPDVSNGEASSGKHSFSAYLSSKHLFIEAYTESTLISKTTNQIQKEEKDSKLKDKTIKLSIFVLQSYLICEKNISVPAASFRESTQIIIILSARTHFCF